jgi:asparagine synthase (glutamine-hydrolysing)
MCGITGIVAKFVVNDRNVLSDMRDAMAHRGPDDYGEWWSNDGCVGLGHRRLSIIDLSSAGHQPMADIREEYHIVFNGEIYNFADLRKELIAKGHVFRSSSDTEVILASYREWRGECLSRLNGAFAFAIYDSVKHSIFMARDRAGEKPLFYSVIDNNFLFSSELKGLMANSSVQRRIDHESLDCYLAMGFIPGDRCILNGVKKLPPAHALEFDIKSGKLQVWRYWQLPELESSVQCQTDEHILLDELEALLADAVRRQLVADVPVGILLSGGVDSSLVTAMAARAGKKISTFTVRFSGYGQYDETEHARLVAQHFGTDHVELDAEEITVDILPLLAKQFDEPIVDSSMIPTYFVSRLVHKHCAVALGGDGGDELFGGYNHYNRLLWMEKNTGWIPRMLRVLISMGAESLLPVGFKGRNWLQGLGIDLKKGLPLIASYYDRTTRQKLMLMEDSWSLVAENIRKQRIPGSVGLLQRATRMDFENYLAEDILVKVDRSSMLNSLEVRAPFLDYRLSEFAFSKVPSHLKTTANERKILLKKLTSRLLPSEFNASRKQGFCIPLDQWLRSGPWKKFFLKVLLDNDQNPFNPKAINLLLIGQTNGRSNSERLFALVMLKLWINAYKISVLD